MVVSKTGKEATIMLFSAGDFLGEEALVAAPGLRLATATATTACIALKIRGDEVVSALHKEHGFSDLFVKFYWRAACASKPILWISFSTPARNASRAFCC